jgi:predicted metal-binding membrane protein
VGGVTSSTTTTVPVARLHRLSVAETSVLLVVAAGAWLATVALATDMDVMPGTMGLGLVAFLGAWTLMMAAMMLPSITPLASLYTRTMRRHRVRRVSLLTIGYLSVWAAVGVVAFLLAAGGERLADGAPGWAQAVAIGSCVACGIYQMTSAKDRCLQHCRSPLGHLLRYTSMRGPLVDARVGVDHGAWCLGCCWGLMVLLVTFGVMNVFAMIVLAAVIVIEKVFLPGRWFSIGVGLAAFGLAVGIWVDPSLAAGFHATPDMGQM